LYQHYPALERRGQGLSAMHQSMLTTSPMLEIHSIVALFQLRRNRPKTGVGVATIFSASHALPNPRADGDHETITDFIADSDTATGMASLEAVNELDSEPDL
jgi:hypothetical protein